MREREGAMSVTVTRRALTEADNAKLAELESQISPVGKLSLFTAMGCVAVYLGAFIALVLFTLK